MQKSPLIMLSPSSPSFNSYSSPPEDLAEIAARVVQEFKNNPESDDADIFSWQEEELQQQQEAHEIKYFAHTHEGEQENNIYKQQNGDEYDDGDEEEFEFSFVCNKESDSSPISADQIFYNGQIRPTYPLFNTALVFNQESPPEPNIPNKTTKKIRLPLRKLFNEEREMATSSSSSEADELECLPPGTYCMWTPKNVVAESSPEKCKKSNSTGSSKRWKFRDLLYRSNSDGNETFVFLTPGKKSENEKEKEKGKGKEGKGTSATVVEERYLKNRASKDGDKRRSFLPYRQDLVGFFSNVNGLSRNLRPL